MNRVSQEFVECELGIWKMNERVAVCYSVCSLCFDFEILNLGVMFTNLVLFFCIFVTSVHSLAVNKELKIFCKTKISLKKVVKDVAFLLGSFQLSLVRVRFYRQKTTKIRKSEIFGFTRVRLVKQL